MTRRTFFNPFGSLFSTTVKLDKDPTMKVKSLEVEGDSGTRFYMRAGAAPQNTITPDKVLWDAVLFLDNDGSVKVRTRDGNVYAMRAEP